MRAVVVLLLALVVGCTEHRVPGFGAVQVDSPFPDEEVAAGVRAFEAAVVRRGHDARRFEVELARARIFWRNGGWQTSKGVVVGTLQHVPGSPEPPVIELAWYPRDALGMTSLSHELMHLLLECEFGDPDANHAEPPGPWTRDDDELIWRVDHGEE